MRMTRLQIIAGRGRQDSDPTILTGLEGTQFQPLNKVMRPTA